MELVEPGDNGGKFLTAPHRGGSLAVEGHGSIVQVLDELDRVAVEIPNHGGDEHTLGGGEPSRGDAHGDLAEGESAVDLNRVGLDFFDGRGADADVQNEGVDGGSTAGSGAVHGGIVPDRGAGVRNSSRESHVFCGAREIHAAANAVRMETNPSVLLDVESRDVVGMIGTDELRVHILRNDGEVAGDLTIHGEGAIVLHERDTHSLPVGERGANEFGE